MQAFVEQKQDLCALHVIQSSRYCLKLAVDIYIYIWHADNLHSHKAWILGSFSVDCDYVNLCPWFLLETTTTTTKLDVRGSWLSAQELKESSGVTVFLFLCFSCCGWFHHSRLQSAGCVFVNVGHVKPRRNGLFVELTVCHCCRVMGIFGEE